MNGKRIVIAVLVIVLIAGLYVAAKNRKMSSEPQNQVAGNSSPTPLPTIAIDPSWETYSNSAYGFSFRYPPAWRLVDNNLDKKGTVQLFNYAANKYIGGEMRKEGDIKIEMIVLEKQEGLLLEDFVQEQTEEPDFPDRVHLYEKVNLGNHDAFSDRTKDDTSYQSYYFELTPSSVLVTTVSPMNQNTDISTILSSFSR